MITANLINFGILIYEGDSLHDAMDKVEQAGFEAIIQNRYDDTSMTYSPVSGWRFV